ncbi:FxsA family protein [Nocardioides euryhalodurans]|uniref:FxsA family protein n=1 Tax=Nocardioides euryhalodurans TaxID=2518370 RepID=A0A4P7GH54_9ACTN|nr:FxsA family protein [Nocardioides euryhalodurans]QBR91208.1 FxsA family protein [Nocardioides euryhalodurans]
MSRRWLRPLLVALFIGVPLLEIYVLVQIGQVIGAWWTILLLVLASIIGTMLVRREGGRAWQALTTALETGRMPHRELADGALILIGGTLMLAPGFVTDAVGVLLILPVTRPVARRMLAGVVARRLLGPVSTSYGPADVRRPGPSGTGPVIRGEVVDDDGSS